MNDDVIDVLVETPKGSRCKYEWDHHRGGLRLDRRLASATVFPANVYVAIAGLDVDGQPGGIYPWLRLPFQALFIAWALWSIAHPGLGEASRASPGTERGRLPA